MKDWKKVKLGELCRNVTSGGTPTSSVVSYYNPPTIPWVKTKEVNYCRIYDAENYISEEGLNNSSAKLIPVNSVIVAMYGQGDIAGRVAINKVPITTNPLRINFYERYQEIIKDYNNEQNRASIEKTFDELMRLSHDLSEEQRRYVKEGFKSDEELSMYELLLKDDLTKDEIRKLKAVAVELLDKIRTQLAGMDHPFEKSTTKAAIIITIRDMLWQELPESYSETSINYYRDQVYNYVCQQYSV